MRNSTDQSSTFSFKYFELEASLMLLLFSSITPGMGQYILLVLGGAFLMIAFAKLGSSNYREYPTKSGYKIVRFIGATLLILVAAIQIYVYFAMPNSVHFSIYATIVDIALVAYLLRFKPSNTSIGKKIFKTVGYSLILIAVNALQNVKTLVSHYPYTAYEINWEMSVFIGIIMLAGVICIKIGSKVLEKKHTSEDISMDERISRFHSCSIKQKTNFKKIITNIALSLSLLAYTCSSLSFMGQGDELTAFGAVFYIPFCAILVVYYLWIIWGKKKVTGAKMLLLPLLQKINMFKAYKDNYNDKKELAKTILPFLLSMIICPMLTTIW